MRRTLIAALPFLLLGQLAFGVAAGDAANLKGLNEVYMGVEINSEADADRALKLETADLVELELRRSDIPFRESILNTPSANYPKVMVTVEIDRSGVRNRYTVTLQVLDHAIIQRNKAHIIAETYRLERTTTKSADSLIFQDVKAEVRAIMASFIDDYRKANNIQPAR